ncbi:MAG: sodium:proton antiporter [Caulobacterales bacterium 32-69-10]|nr:MAG: sodium:proton antiporter [Caulobacterales bacterium 32-69-10]
MTDDTPTRAAASPDRAAIIAALNQVRDPKSGQGLVAAGLVHGLAIGPGRAGFMLEVPPADVRLYAQIRDAAEAALRTVPGVEKAQVVLTAEEGGAAPYAPAPGTVRVRKGARLSADAQSQAIPKAPEGALKPPHVKQVLAVSSAKGGVGKSTVAVNLAVALARLGLRIGLLDADVYGPSAPKMLGIDDGPQTNADKKLVPLEAWGIKAISIGFLVDEGAPMIWRGPMASSALNQLLNDVAWGNEAEPLDVLVVDMPPGTGDIQLSLVQRVALAGAVLVSTPQEVALIDVRRGAAMFEKTATPILGVVENMSYFPDPTTGAPIPIFGHGGAKATAEKMGVPFLGEVPIDIALREACDDGRPIVAAKPDSPSAKAFMHIAEQVAERLAGADASKPAPTIVFED